jgi:hypothetical protein
MIPEQPAWVYIISNFGVGGLALAYLIFSLAPTLRRMDRTLAKIVTILARQNGIDPQGLDDPPTKHRHH